MLDTHKFLNRLNIRASLLPVFGIHFLFLVSCWGHTSYYIADIDDTFQILCVPHLWTNQGNNMHEPSQFHYVKALSSDVKSFFKFF